MKVECSGDFFHLELIYHSKNNWLEFSNENLIGSLVAIVQYLFFNFFMIDFVSDYLLST